MSVTNKRIIEIVNAIIGGLSEMWDEVPFIDEIDENTNLDKIQRLTGGIICFEFGKYPTKISEHPIAYESTDDGAQGTTEFYYNEDGQSEFIIEVYDALPNYAIITIYQ